MNAETVLNALENMDYAQRERLLKLVLGLAYDNDYNIPGYQTTIGQAVEYVEAWIREGRSAEDM